MTRTRATSMTILQWIDDFIWNVRIDWHIHCKQVGLIDDKVFMEKVMHLVKQRKVTELWPLFGR